MNKRIVLGIGAGVAAFAAVTASAASLGGITTGDLGADASVVAACDTDGITVDYTTSYEGGAYRVSGVTLGGVSVDCTGQTVTITLADGADASLAEESDTVVTALLDETHAVTFNPTVSAESVENIAVVISG